MRNSLTLLNEKGDTTISWDESNDEKMIALIDKKMKEGMTFFIIKTKLLGLIPIKAPAKNIIDAVKNRQVYLKDEDFNEIMFGEGVSQYKRNSSHTLEAEGVLSKAEDAKDKHLIGINQRKGG